MSSSQPAITVDEAARPRKAAAREAARALEAALLARGTAGLGSAIRDQSLMAADNRSASLSHALNVPHRHQLVASSHLAHRLSLGGTRSLPCRSTTACRSFRMARGPTLDRRMYANCARSAVRAGPAPDLVGHDRTMDRPETDYLLLPPFLPSSA